MRVRGSAPIFTYDGVASATLAEKDYTAYAIAHFAELLSGKYCSPGLANKKTAGSAELPTVWSILRCPSLALALATAVEASPTASN